jgi:hypothetical protein
VSEHYRRLAQECLEMAPTIEDEDSRASLIEMARVCTSTGRVARLPKSVV